MAKSETELEPKETLADARTRWKFRRIAFFSQQAAFNLMLGYLVVYGSPENSVQTMIASALPYAIVGSLMAYIGGPIADDWLQMRMSRSS